MPTQQQVARVMTEAVLSIGIEEPTSEVLRYFASYPIHHLPVVRDSKVVGMLSSADVMKLEHFLPSRSPAANAYLDKHLRIESLLRGPVVTVQAHQSLEDAAVLMAQHGIHALPVVDAHGNLIGILTTTDIMQAALRPEGSAAADKHTADTAAGALSDAQFDRAMAAAKQACAAGQDPDGLARALLYLQQRLRGLEEVARVAERFITAGQDEQLHATLLRAIAQLKQQHRPGGPAEPAQLGLGGG